MANLSAEEPDALMRARPGLWEPWRVTARATRPDARRGAARFPHMPEPSASRSIVGCRAAQINSSRAEV